MRKSGIYKINSVIKPNRIYIGSSVDIRKRFTAHKYLLKEKKHPNKKLQNHYNKYGLNDLRFTIITTCDVDLLIEKEQFFIDAYNPYFNLRPKAENNFGWKPSEETLEKYRNRIISEKTKEKLREANLGKKLSEETKQKCRSYKHTKEARQKISDALRRRTPTDKMIRKLKERRSVKVIDISTGIIYDSIVAAANAFGMKRRTLENKLHESNGVNPIKNNTTLRFYKEVA